MGQVEKVAVVVIGSFNRLEGYAAEADDAASGDEAGSEEGARRNFAVGVGSFAAGFLHGLVDKPANNAADEDGQSGADGQVRADGKCERANAEQLDGDDQEDAE